MGQAWSKLQQKRNARALGELTPRKTPGQDSPLPTLDRETLLTGLTNVAAYIAGKGKNVTIIAVGGAVNTIYLQSRSTTHDVDFFNNALTVKDYKYLIKGARAAARHDPRLQEEWFNNRTVFFIPKDRRDVLTQQALTQHEVIFQAEGLTVLAAPWHYAFCCKIDRLAGGGLNAARSYDLNDAVQYLYRYLSIKGLSGVHMQDLQAWFADYSLRWTSATEQVISRVNETYGSRVIF